MPEIERSTWNVHIKAARHSKLVLPTAFYDWLYLNALGSHRDWIEAASGYPEFTDIEFNPAKSVNCQDRALAGIIALARRGLLDCAMNDFDIFAELVSQED